MGMIRIYQGKSKKQPKKPGWKEQEAQYQEWLKSVNSQTLGAAKKNRGPQKKAAALPVVNKPVIRETEVIEQRSTAFGSGTKPVPRPDIVYKDNPELLARELQARERKFNVAPAYNKGGDVFVTEEELSNQLKGNRRRP